MMCKCLRVSRENLDWVWNIRGRKSARVKLVLKVKQIFVEDVSPSQGIRGEEGIKSAENHEER